ncbi:sulfatase [Vibrio variabilis]|uniref:Sulfatase n=1 Tax=Vibrio variabilis TaxID=990271 RepID=A0ABQ0JKA0_9VIBR|nr:sulfatase [Vibrio variabilis]
MFVIFLLYVVDAFIIYWFKTRLYISDYDKYASDIHLAMSGMGWQYYAFLLFLFGLFYRFMMSKGVKVGRQVAVLLVVTMGSLMVVSNAKPNSVRNVFYVNLFKVNINDGYRERYSDSFIAGLSYEPTVLCKPSKIITPEKILIVVVESWSNYHSQYFGGEENWTPHLDELASQNVALKRFYANGFSTEDGLYSMLMGEPMLANSPIGKLNGINDLSLLENQRQSLIEELNDKGYETHFITSGSLEFVNKATWLTNIGFRKLIDQADFSQDLERYLFSSVNDEILFERAYDEISVLNGKQFVVVENVTTHAPFVVPVDGESVISEERAFNYTDKYAARFIEKAKDDNWMIIVVSDHRAMTQLTDLEKRTEGIMASSRVPAFLVWNDIQFELDTTMQQSDLLSGLVNAMDGRSCYGDLQSAYIPLEQAKSAECIVHKRGDDRALISLQCEGHNVNVQLSGDDTRQVEGIEMPLAVNIVNYLRVRQMH